MSPFAILRIDECRGRPAAHPGCEFQYPYHFASCAPTPPRAIPRSPNPTHDHRSRPPMGAMRHCLMKFLLFHAICSMLFFIPCFNCPFGVRATWGGRGGSATASCVGVSLAQMFIIGEFPTVSSVRTHWVPVFGICVFGISATSNVRRALACHGGNRAYISNVSQMRPQMYCRAYVADNASLMSLNAPNATCISAPESSVSGCYPRNCTPPAFLPPASSPGRRRGFPPSIRKPEWGWLTCRLGMAAPSLSKFVSALPKCAIPVVCLVNHIWAPTSESFRHGPCLGIPNRYPDLIDERIFH